MRATKLENGTKSASRIETKSGRRGERGQMRNGVVDVAGLGVGVVGAGEIAAAEPVAQLLEPRRRPSSSIQTLKFG